MSGMNRVTTHALLFGHETGLLLSRKSLLSTIGCNCLVITTLAASKEALLSGSFDLFILCQTLSGDECTSASQFVEEHRPGIPLLIMFARHARCEPHQQFVVLDASSGPEAFLHTAGRLLAQSDASMTSAPFRHPSSAVPI